VADRPYHLIKCRIPGRAEGSLDRYGSLRRARRDLPRRIRRFLCHLLHPGDTINPAALGLGAAIVGIELGNVYMYQAGWTVNTAFIVSNGLIVLALMVMGTLLYGEKITPRKILGVVISMAGIAAITLG